MSGQQALEPRAAEAQQPSRYQHVAGQPADLVRQFEICAAFGISDETWRRWVKRGDAPKPVDLPGRPRWRRADVERFKQGRRLAEGHRTFFGSAVRSRG